MDSLEFECPLCNGLFSAALADVEVSCPHCDENVSLSAVDPSSSANATMVAKRIAMPEPLFPPGHKKSPASEPSATPETAPELPPIVIMDGDVDESVDDTESITPSATLPDELPTVVVTDDDVDESGDESVDESESITPLETVANEMPTVVIIDDDVGESVDGPELITPPAAVPEKLPAVVTAKDDKGESPDSTETDTAIDDLLPPGFQLDDQQIETHTDIQETTEAAVIIDVRVDTEPTTVGRGINKRELRSRTPDEKSQFMRKKNLVVWAIGALIIIVTMVVMLQLT